MIYLLGLQLSFASPSPEEILQSVDQNLSYQNRSASVTMTVQTTRREKVYQMNSVTLNRETAIEFQAPARDSGTKMLKKGEQLWVYLPNIEKVQRISGHMLEQGLMGSSVSYQDLMESTELSKIYRVTELKEVVYENRPCYQLHLEATSASTAYQQRISWIDQELLIPHKEEYYAVSGKLLKTMTMTDYQSIEGRNTPTNLIITDQLQPDLQTTLTFSEISFQVEDKESMFQQRWLER